MKKLRAAADSRLAAGTSCIDQAARGRGEENFVADG
jgi:hypothetical protein